LANFGFTPGHVADRAADLVHSSRSR
jgi:hypothetical protein